MSQPLQTPLIPLPASTSSAETSNNKDDIFATLFSPPTPRASPVPSPAPIDVNVARPPLSKHLRTTSADSDFGAFVSVPATEDPLHSSAPEMTPFSPIQNINFFDRFAEEARSASEKNRREVLDELLAHEDDPLYFLQLSKGSDAEYKTTPAPAPSQTPELPVHEQKLVDLVDQAHTSEARQPRHLGRRESISEFDAVESHSSPVRSPSLPPSSPVRLSTPEIQRTQSFFTPTSLPSRWVSSFLSSTVRPSLPRTRSSTEEARKHGDVHPPSQASGHHAHTLTLPTTLPSQLLDSLGSLTASASTAAANVASSTSVAVDAAITHGTPFASHPFVPASGAPGFAGDRQWDKGFEYDKSNVEKKSVRLVGRKEMTTPVLTGELADMLRPYFPALARLPRSWSLLYSLDQHGISLNTLYTRCQNHQGGALVIIRDSSDGVFGAWMGQGIHQSKGSYYGSGESFLWKLASDKRLRVYKWTGRNDYVALCEPEYLSFGGGDGHYGLYLDDSLTDGSSARCPTFDNDPLCSAGPKQGENVRFECVGLEVWGVG